MSFGKMNTQIDIISTTPVKDADGFVTNGDHVVASIRAYKEDRHGNERWANMAVFSEATALFRFRKIPGTEITTSLFIVCGNEQYRIVSAEDVRGRGMYVEVLAEKQEGTVR
ncbi:head-tail adaptor protein [Novisyntrophococcus fermenticellae]|uniref:head-tail adaptor protein n=1 Tax=Novisyntrophococcus fermenticellae TaxID=2068655 RepID=UPI001E5846FB|nr:head-tail adaptor protein [Novisyntrophococcus fermenticellae]